MANLLKPSHFHDLGKLSLAFVMLWAYFNFSQYLLIYAANLIEEIPYFIARISHGWQYLALFLVIFHFAVPFLLLLSRDLKRMPHRLVVGGAGAAGRALHRPVHAGVAGVRRQRREPAHAGRRARSGVLRALARSGGAAGDRRPVALDVLHPAGAAAAAGRSRDPYLREALESTGGH